MSKTTNMQLVKWEVNDYFNDSELRDNWDKVDQHDHASKGGVKIPDGGLDVNSVGTAQIKDSSITNKKIADGSIDKVKMQTDIIGAIDNAKNALSTTTSFDGDVNGLSNSLSIKSSVVQDKHLAAKTSDYLGVSVDKLNLPTYSNIAASSTNKLIDRLGLSSALSDTNALPTLSGSAIGTSNKAIDVGGLGSITRSQLSSTAPNNIIPQTLTWSGSTPPSLPNSAVTGDEVYYAATQSGDVVWHLRYGGSQWAFVGGGPLSVFDTTSRTSGTINKDTQNGWWFRNWVPGSPVVDETAFPRLSIPLAGSYEISVRGTLGYDTSASATIGIAVALSGTQSAGNASANLISYSSGYTFGNFGVQDVDYVSPFASFSYSVASNTTSDDRYFQTIVRVAPSANTEMTFYSGYMSIRPISLTNWN